jgi:hypothetical protein
MMKLMIIKLIHTYALQYGMDPNICISVAAVESQFNPNVIGITGDVGVFQLNPKSFPQYTVKQLKDPKLNIQLGIKYLAKVKKECKYKEGLNWLVCWNYGPKNAKKVKHPGLFPYVKKVKTQLVMNEKEL